MKPRLFWTMLLAFTLVIVLSVCGMLGFVALAVSGQWQPAAVRETFREFQQTYALSLGDYYVANGESWVGVEQRFETLPAVGPGNFFDYALADENGQIIASTDSKYPAGTVLSEKDLKGGIVVRARNRQVGTLLFDNGPRGMMQSPPAAPNPPTAPARGPRAVFWPILRSFLIAAGVLVTGLLLMALFFVQRISRPLRTLTVAAQQLATGALDVQVKPAPIREVNELTQAFNSMARSLASADRQRRQMTADIAHELRTPLTIIKGRLEGMQDGVYEAKPEELERLLGETALLERLIEDLRLLALAENGQLPLYREPIDPRELLDNAHNAFARQAAEQHVALAVDAPDDLPALDADPQRLAQVLANLVANALRYTPEGGSITLGAHTAGQEGADVVVLEVRDTGAGIPADDLPHVFDRFYRADRSRARSSGGTGLGLAIARQIVLSHGGTIQASSTEGQGTTMTITLPLEGSAALVV
jgi:two-component system OmpR family sensor kinase/two-component system sensor histidine kinase BaeS